MKKEVDAWRESAQDENMDVEGEGDGEEEEDIIEGCYALDIDIDGIESLVWVRAEYILIFSHITEVHNTLIYSKRIDKKSYCVILTGQPGIRKSKFFGYAMRRCRAEE